MDKTPGVYMKEDAFPSSVVEVATAVPAFVGYTEKHSHGEDSLLRTPWRVTSLADFVEHFGGPPSLAGTFTLEPAAGQGETEYHLVQAEGSRWFHLYNGLASFYQNGGGPCYIVSVGQYDDEKGMRATDFAEGIAALLEELEPTMLVLPDAVLLPAAECRSVQEEALRHCAATRKRIAILDIHGGYLPRPARDDRTGQRDCIEDFRAISGDGLRYGVAYYPWIDTTVVAEDDPRLTYEAFDEEGVAALQAMLTRELVDPLADEDAKRPALQKLIDDLADPEASVSTTNGALRVVSRGFRDLLGQVLSEANRLPPSATMAGIYTMVDNSRGAWKAPANVSLSGVVRPTVSITHDDQEDLNVTPTGKSVNAIRTFVGEGTLVWGARTLEGNSLDWRYVNVLRTMIMLEQSIALACRAYAFESNDANTWTTIRSVIRSFLDGIWKRGGLAGATPDEAFSVHVGLGETMTPEDVADGILRLTARVALSRPGELMEIAVEQQMQKA